MLKNKFLLTITLLLISPVFIQLSDSKSIQAQQVQDIQGWNNTRWGMTYAEVKSLYPIGNLQESQSATAFSHFASMESFNIGENTYKVEFYFNKNRLESVILRWDENGHSPYYSLLNNLNNRYGQGVNVASHLPQNFLYQKQWNMPTTAIVMTIPVGICPTIYACEINLSYSRQQQLEGI